MLNETSNGGRRKEGERYLKKGMEYCIIMFEVATGDERERDRK